MPFLAFSLRYGIIKLQKEQSPAAGLADPLSDDICSCIYEKEEL